ncbi:hypothetical protein T439DRAFT_84454 [Meredithblackwellia eburnea MCA 4105]
MSVIIKGSLTKSLGPASLVSQTIGGFEIPGILSVGPSVDLLGTVSFVLEGVILTKAGGTLDWKKVDYYFDLDHPFSSSKNGLPPAVFSSVAPKTDHFGLQELAAGISFQLEPRVLFALDFKLLSSASVRGGIAARTGMGMSATLGSSGGLSTDVAPVANSCPRGVNFTLALQDTQAFLFYGIGAESSMTEKPVATLLSARDLYSHCFDISAAVCGKNSVYNAGAKIKCTAITTTASKKKTVSS